MGDETTDPTTSRDPQEAIAERDRLRGSTDAQTNPENAPADGSDNDQRDSAATERDGGTHS
ncbi:MAG: hypothetical protein JWN72_2165 [Thermoleophilia bacterium]|nr:hypothetical protein [Thermoleophilia bacterium]